MPEQVDQEALKDSRKALAVIMILAILLSTGYFFYLYIDRTYRFFYNPRKFIISVLTGGDLFLGLFTLFVYARNTYEKDYRPGCSTQICALVYGASYFPFVYAVGLIVLAVEIVFRQRIRATFSKPDHCSVVVAGVPWLLGLILILPLTMAGIDWDRCRFDGDSDGASRRRAIVWISVVIPSAIAVVVSFIVKQMKLNVPSSVTADQAGRATNPPPPQQPSEQQGADRGEPAVYTYSNAPSEPSASEPNPQAASASYTSLETAQSTAPTGSQYIALSLLEKEKTADLLVAVLFAVFSLPLALFTLGYNLNNSRDPLDPIPYTVLAEIFFWLTIVRSVVLPMVWARLTSQAL